MPVLNQRVLLSPTALVLAEFSGIPAGSRVMSERDPLAAATLEPPCGRLSGSLALRRSLPDSPVALRICPRGIHWLAQPRRGILAVLASAEQQGDPGDLPQRDPLSACQGHAAALPGGAAEFGGIPMGSAAQGIPADPPSSLPQAPLPFSGRRLPAGDEGWLSHPGEPLSHPRELLSPPGELLASRAAMLRVLDVGLERCLALHSAYIPVPRHR